MIAFSVFFKQWINEYYSKGVSVGKKGDFYTSVSVGNLFGVLLANHFLKLLDNKKLSLPIDIVEIGANEGHLMFDFIQALYTLRQDVLAHMQCHIIEPHERLRFLQNNLFKKYDLEVHIHDSINQCNFNNAFFYANELFDCFTCELIKDEKMAFVKDFKIEFHNATDEILSLAKKYRIKNSELCLEYQAFLRSLKNSCKNMIFASFDYAKIKEDISLRIYKEHQIFDPFKINLQDFFAKSDITYNVNYDHLMKVLKEENLEILEYKNQNQALIDFGLEEILEFTKKQDLKIYENFITQSKNLIFNFGDKFKFLEFRL